MEDLFDRVDGNGAGRIDVEGDLEMGRIQAAVDETETMREVGMKIDASTSSQSHSAGSDLETDVEDDLAIEKLSAYEDQSEAFTPTQHSRSMKVVSDGDFEAIVEEFMRPGATWQQVVTKLDTVCIKRSSDGRTLLHCFSSGPYCDRDLCSHLLRAGVPADKDVWEYAFLSTDHEMCKLLCDCGADINFRTDDGISPMVMALQNGYSAVVDWLIHSRKYSLKWDNNLFKLLCTTHSKLVVPYLDLFAEELPQNLMQGRVEDFSSRSGFKYRFLEDIYGSPNEEVADTPLALVLRSSVACDALACKVMRHIIKAKWLTFGKTMFRQEVSLYAALVVAFSVSIIWEQLGFKIVSGVCSALLLVRNEGAELSVEGRAYFHSFWNLLGAGTYVGIILVVICQVCGVNSEILRVSTGVLSITLWMNMYQYLQTTERFAVLVTMMSYMVGDVAKFILLYSMFLFGFSGAFYVLFITKGGYETFPDALKTVVLMLFGQFNLDPFDKATGLTWIVANLLLLVYLMSVVIVLVNLLIAMMSTSYANVWDEAEGQVLLSFAKTIIRVEPLVSRANRAKQIQRLKKDHRWGKEARSKLERTLLRKGAMTALSESSFFSRRWRAEAFEYLHRSLLLLQNWLLMGSTQTHVGSLDLLAPAITRCSTLEDGDRWEFVRRKSGDDQQTQLNSQVNKLTSIIEKQTTLINELSLSIHAPGGKTLATVAKGGKVATNTSVEVIDVSDHQAALNARVDTLTVLVEQQTALIKDLSDSVRTITSRFRVEEPNTQRAPLSATE